MNSRPLTGWLILLIVFFVVSGCVDINILERSDAMVRRLRADYPNVETAHLVFELLVGAAMLASFYGAWVVFRRESGTLLHAQLALVAKWAFGVGSTFAMPLLAGFPPNIRDSVLFKAYSAALISTIPTAAWLLYLARSERVKDIFTPTELPQEW